MKSMLSDPKFVTEDYRTEDLLNFEDYIHQLKLKADGAPAKSLFGIIGDYGTGKSVMLENLRTKMTEDCYWVHFDAWKYPERNNLWEGFVLDFVRQVSPKDFQAVLKKMEGTSKDATKTLIGTFGSAVNLFLPGSKGAIDKLTYFTDTSPAKRVFQIQDVLESLLKKRLNKPIYVVVEDADRSGDAGIYFIETLNQFLKNLELKNTIKVFIPIARKSFLSDKKEAYVKALDYVEFFDLTSRNLQKFVETVFDKDLVSDDLRRHHLIEWLQRLAAIYGLTIRDIKFVIRNSEIQYKTLQQKGLKPDPRVVLVIESTRFITENVSGVKISAYDYIRSNQNKVHNRTQVEMILYAIGQNITVEQVAEILNESSSNDNIFKRQVRFIDKDVVSKQTDTSVPFQHEGQYTLPLYYI